MPQKKVTINDVAAAANVSKSVVSSVLSGRTGTIRFSEKTRDHVLEIARAVHYHPSLIARGLNARKSFLLAYMCISGGSIGTTTRLIQDIQDTCRRHGYSLIVYISDTLEQERTNLSAAMERQVDGLIVTPYMYNEESNFKLYEKIHSEGTPVIFLESECPGISTIQRSTCAMGYDAVMKFHAAGRRRISFLTYPNYRNPVTGPASYREWTGYSRAMQELGLPPRVLPVDISYGPQSPGEAHKTSVIEFTRQQLDSILGAEEELPDAILASTHSLAYGVGLALQERHIRIPEDLAIISCKDDYILPPSVFPELTCYPLETGEAGSKAVRYCLNPEERPDLTLGMSLRPGRSFPLSGQS